MTHLWKLGLACSTVLLAAACGPAPVGPPDTGSGGDAAVTPDAAAPSDAAPTSDAPITACANTPPSANFCSNVQCNVAPFDLISCDGDGTQTYPFYNTDYCSSQVTVLVVAAGWCVPCMMEAPMIEELITQGYADRGVRVVTVLGQNPNYGPPTVPFCNMWKDRYGLTSHMTIDPMGITQAYFPNMAFPANIVIDRHGQIVYRQYGTQTGLHDLINAIEMALQ